MQLRERSKQNPAIADGVECVRFGREMEGDNINAPLLSLTVLYGFQPVSETPSAGIRLPDTIVQASAIHLQAATVTGVQMATATATVIIGSMVFSSLNTPSPSIPV